MDNLVMENVGRVSFIIAMCDDPLLAQQLDTELSRSSQDCLSRPDRFFPASRTDRP